MPDAYRLSITETTREIQNKNLSPVSLAETLINRIDKLDPELKAWVTVDREDVIGQAKQTELDQEKGIIKPLQGVSVGLKDIFYTAGMRTSACSRILSEFVPDYDATSVAKLKAAGAMIIGKAVTTEFASSDPSPSLNPWNLNHTPGGSSSGSSVAVATGMCTAALGSQTGGSTCRPAAYNGIVGLKPTYGRVSKHGVVPLSWSLDTVGILVRSVEDAALMLQVMSGHDPLDPHSANEPVPNFVEQMNRSKQKPVIGLIKDFFFEHSTPEVASHTEQVAQELASAGAEIREITLPDSFRSSHACQRIVSNVEAAAFHREWYKQRADEYGPKIRGNIEMGMLISGIDYLQAQRLRRQFRTDMVHMLNGIDALLMPTTPTPAPGDLTTTGDAVFQAPWTSSGLPTVTIPSGIAANGLPLGTQLAGLPFEEGSLLGIAKWCEQVLNLDLWPNEYV